jgi:hypothetical protein
MSGTGMMMCMAAGQALAQMLIGGGSGAAKGMMGGRGGEMTPPEGMGEAPTMAG